MSMLDIHQAALEEVNGAYHEFLLKYSEEKLSVYGFVEGKDDPSFYRSIIDRFLPENWSVEIFVSGNRKKVLSTESEFDWNRFNRKQIVFFVDRDLIHFLSHDMNYPDNIYVSDGYSIENYIVTKDVFFRILQEALNIVNWTDSEEEALSDFFLDQVMYFQDAMAPLMAQIAIWRQNNVSANLNNLDLPSIFTFNNGRCAVKSGYEDPSARVQRLCECVGAAPASHAEREEMERRFREIDGPSQLTRGKYLIWFFAMIANDIHKNISVFVSSYVSPPKIRIAFGPKNLLIIAAPRARIPNSLRDFLEKTHTQFIHARDSKPHIASLDIGDIA